MGRLVNESIRGGAVNRSKDSDVDMQIERMQSLVNHRSRATSGTLVQDSNAVNNFEILGIGVSDLFLL